MVDHTDGTGVSKDNFQADTEQYHVEGVSWALAWRVGVRLDVPEAVDELLHALATADKGTPDAGHDMNDDRTPRVDSRWVVEDGNDDLDAPHGFA